MKKKLISLALLAGLLLSSLTGCGGTADDDASAATEAASAKTATITLTAITGKSTTPDAIAAVQEAMNKLTKKEHKTQVILQLKTEDEYVDFIDSQVEKIEAEIAAKEEAEALRKEELKKKKEAEKAANANTKKRSKWTTTTKAETSDTGEETQEMTLDEFGREVVKYPDLEGTSLDILFITGLDMFRDFVDKEYLSPLNEELTGSSKILNKYIYPTLLTAGKDGSTTYAIVNNRLIGEYTYLLVDKTLAAKYNLDTTKVKTLTDCEEFLDAVKANEPDYIPLSEAVDLNYLQYCGFEGSMMGSIIKSNFKTSSKAVPKNLLDTGDYVAHEVLLDKLENGGYIGSGDQYAIEVRKGYITTPEEENWEENYNVITYELPICDNSVYEGMFAVSAYASDVSRCMEIVTMLNTNAELRNIYAYGVEGVNYNLNEDGTVHMLNNDWSMNFYHTGNTFVGAVPETLPANYAEIGKLQNVKAITGPYFMWVYENEETAALYEDFKSISEKYMTAFENAADKAAYAESVKDEMKENETLAKMLSNDESAGFVASYIAFQEATYPSGS